MARQLVLVVDDELSIRELLTHLLGQLGYDSQTACNSAEALIKLGLSDFDLALVDLEMPGMKGDELAREIKRRRHDIPVVLVTGSPPLSRPPGIDQVLRKPFSAAQLRATIDSLT